MQEKKVVIFENSAIRVERIHSFGLTSPKSFWYDQKEDEFVMIEKGSAVLELEKSKILLNQGETYYIKANEKHRVDYTSNDCVWLCVFLKP